MSREGPKVSGSQGPGVPGSQTLLDLAVRAVRKAGEIQLAHLTRGDVEVRSKGVGDIVTDVDIAVETMFREMIAHELPGHRVLGEELEETPAAGHDAVHRWLFDPIDGTANYAHGLPFFCASLALEIHGVVELGAVYEPVRGELFTAVRGHGASLNGTRIQVSNVSTIEDAALGCGFPHGAKTRVAAMENLLGEAAIRARAIRRLGSAALDLSYVAAGRMDAFWDDHLKPWDTAAGALIVTEAGGTVTDLDGAPFSCHHGGVLASNGRLHAAMLEMVRRASA